MHLICFAAITLLVSAGCSHARPLPEDSTGAMAGLPPGDAEPKAPLFEGLGSYNHPITATDPRVQRYFDQGMVLSFGFNHAEAERSFRYAAALDESCAMCWWGVA